MSNTEYEAGYLKDYFGNMVKLVAKLEKEVEELKKKVDSLSK